MPLHEYRCEACGHELDKIQKMTDKPLKTCPACKKRKLVKKLASGSFILKGQGFYKPGHS